MKPKERIFREENDMTKYQIAHLKRAIRRDLTKKQRFNKTVYNFPRENTEKKLPEYISNNPWY